MRVTMLLCDHAVVADGKLYINGGGWSVTGPDPVPSAIALKLDVPWDRANETMRMTVRLVGEDGQPVTVSGPQGEQAVEISGEFEVGRPSGLKHGAPIDMAMAFNIGALPLPPGRRFSWMLSINEETHEDWHLTFHTREVPSGDATYVVDPPG